MASPSIAACHRMQGDTQAFGQKLCASSIAVIETVAWIAFNE